MVERKENTNCGKERKTITNVSSRDSRDGGQATLKSSHSNHSYAVTAPWCFLNSKQSTGI